MMLLSRSLTPPRAWSCGALAALGLALASCSFGIDPDGSARFTCAEAKDCGEKYECRPQKGQERGLCYPLGQCADAETKCDGRDEDCNGVVDDVEWAGTACDSDQPGVCRAGQRACADGAEQCLPATAPAAEQCNGLDDDCDGQTDEDFDLAADPANCGECGHACAEGSACVNALCAELDCADGMDNDGDGRIDCNDSDCFDRSCAVDGGFACGLVPAPPGDGGMDADAGEVDGGGFLDAGTDLVPDCLPRESACKNKADDDGDGRVDCEDPDCAGAPGCADAGS